MPILGDREFKLPWALIAPHEAQSLANHGQSLDKIAYRGGFSYEEAAAVMENRKWAPIKWADGKDRPGHNPGKIYLENLIARRIKEKQENEQNQTGR